MITDNQITLIFCEVDDFCKEFEKNNSKLLITDPPKNKSGPKCCLTGPQSNPF